MKGKAHRKSSAARLLRIAAVALLYALYGCWRIVRGLVVGLRRMHTGIRHLTRDSILCPSCRAMNPRAGRYLCGTCSAEFHGDVCSCRVCGAGARFFPCRRCGISIPLKGYLP